MQTGLKSHPLWPGQDLDDQANLNWVNPDADRPCVVVLPGGGYGKLAPHEAEPVAKRFADAGFSSCVVRYRLGPNGHRHPAMLHDAQRGVRMVRAFGCPSVAILGFSAGGHLAATTATLLDEPACPDDDLAPQHTARPDAAVLCYPVLHLAGETAHRGSRANLLGRDFDPDLSEALSAPRRVTERTPPTFLWHTTDDPAVDARGSFDFASACRACGVPCELHSYEHGPHGIGEAPDHPEARGWVDLAAAFLHRHLNA